jgi:hypothetical protein
MDFTEKARVRIAHWVEHSENHLKEYETFAQELETNGKNESAQQIREMAALAAQGNGCLARALKALG